jgi:hypothetical protein
MSPACCSARAVRVIVARRTSSMLARNSCVMGNWSACMRSWVVSSQRAQRSSVPWCRLQAAVWMTWSYRACP